MKIVTKINLGFILTFIFVLLIIGIVAENYSSNLAKRNAESFIVSSGKSKAEHIRTFVKDQEVTSVILSAASIYRDILKESTSSKQYEIIKEKINKRLARTLESDPQIQETFILNADGKVIASSDISREGVDMKNSEYFVRAQDSVYFKDIYMSSSTNKLNYTISSPIKDDAGKTLGVSVLRYIPESFFSIVKSENGFGDSEENFLINKDKILITPSHFFGEEYVLNKKIETKNADDCFNTQEIDYITKNGYRDSATDYRQHIVVAKDYRGVNVLATHHYIPETGWCLITKVDQSDVFAFVTTLRWTFFLVFIFASIMFLFIGLMISKKITNPLQILKREAKNIENGNFDDTTNIETGDEIEDLSNAIKAMSSQIRQSKSDIHLKVKELEEQKIAILNILEDVESEKDKSEELSNDLEKFKLAVDNASDQIVITDPEGIVVYANKSLEKITGYTVEEALNKKAGKLWSNPMPTEYYKKMWETIKTKKEVFTSEISNKRKNGDSYIATLSVSPVLDDNNDIRFFVAIEHDITKEKEIDKEKTEFVSLASHQLKTPVGAIRWNLEMLLDGDYGEISDKQKEVLNDSYIMNMRMNELINALLNVSRIESGTFIVEPTPTNFILICEEVIKEMEVRIKDKGHKLTKSFSNSLPIVLADAKLLRIIFQNFISNAIKYTPSSGEITVLIKSDDKEITLSVENNGDPIPEDDQSKIFSKMFRASNAQEQDADGNGLGLYIVKQIIDNAGGKLWFTSKKGENTVFACSFPLSGMTPKSGTKELS